VVRKISLMISEKIEAGRKRVVLGIDFGATNLKALLLDKEGRIYQQFIERSEPNLGPESTLKRIVDLIRRAEKKADSTGLRLTDIGIGVCGPVNHATGEIIESPILPGWKNVPVAGEIYKEIGLPVHVDNDANLAILGEWWLGAGKRNAIVTGLTLGTGIGGGFIINGCIYRGGFGFGAEFGHISLAADPLCPCGGRGCLGRVASATATLNRYKQLAGVGASTVYDIIELGRLAENGDNFAKDSIAISADFLAKAILILINCLNPDVFVIAGGMALLGNILLNPIQDYIRSSTFRIVGESTNITTATLGINSGCFGSAWLALSEAKVLPR
jgi:glucokinase